MGHISGAELFLTIHGDTRTSTVRRANALRTKSYLLGPTVKKAEVERQPISRVGRVNSHYRERGFALIEILCVLAIIGLLAAVILPTFPTSTSRTKLEGFATETAALLKADRNVAIRRQIQVATRVDASTRSIRSGASGRIVRLPSDVVMNAMLASRCSDRVAGKSIDFFPSGMSCGGTITLVRPGISLEIRVNWLTGGVEIVPQKRL
jgi:general secretion pathway protein H